VKILITGAAGFIGSHLFKATLDLGEDVIGIDNLSDYYSVDYKVNRLAHLGLSKTKKFIECDISDFQQIESIILRVKPDYVVHLAAQAGVRIKLADSDSYISSNIIGFHNVVRAAMNSDVKGVLYASSSSVYGDATPTPYKESAVSLRPKSIYGVTKLSNELFAEIQSKSSKLRFRGLRYFTVYGPWGRPDMAYFRIAAASLGQGSFTLFGDGSVRRDFTYIDDVVDKTITLLMDLARRSEGFNDVVNVGGSRPLDMSYLIELISKRGDNRLQINQTTENKSDSLITMADNTYLKSIIGESKFTDLESGVELLMDWAKGDTIRGELLNWIKSTV
jgi:UDP-glucuronate 4-epimerase